MLQRASAPAVGDSNGDSSAPALSHDGSVVVFATEADNIAAGAPDGNDLLDVVRVDLGLSQRIRVSAPVGGEGNGPSGEPVLSGDGRFVVFASGADNLGGGDVNGATDVFLVDVLAGTGPQLLSTAASGSANGASSGPAISADGETIVFSSAASDLVGSDGNAQADVFLVDRPNRVKRRIARGDGGTQANGGSSRPRLNRNGQRIAFHSAATNLSLREANGGQADVFINGPLEPFLIFRGRFE